MIGHEHYTSIRTPISYFLKRLNERIERISHRACRTYLAHLVPRKNLLHTLPHQIGRTLPIVAHLKTANFDVLDQKVIRLNAGYATRSKADNHQASPPGKCAQRRIKSITANGIEHYIGPLTVVLCKNL